jgi:hypothetical protein
VKVAVVDSFSPLVSDTSPASLRFFYEPFVNAVKRSTNLERPVLFHIQQYFVPGSTDDLPIDQVVAR